MQFPVCKDMNLLCNRGYAPSSRIHHVLHDDCATALQHYRTCVLDSMKYFSKLKELGTRARRDNTYVHDLKRCRAVLKIHDKKSRCTHVFVYALFKMYPCILICSNTFMLKLPFDYAVVTTILGYHA